MRYYFDVSENGTETRDLDGMECADEARMHHQARMILAEIARDSGSVAPHLSTRVRDAQGRYVYEAQLRIEARAL
jgi:hypothetical protein